MLSAKQAAHTVQTLTLPYVDLLGGCCASDLKLQGEIVRSAAARHAVTVQRALVRSWRSFFSRCARLCRHRHGKPGNAKRPQHHLPERKHGTCVSAAGIAPESPQLIRPVIGLAHALNGRRYINGRAGTPQAPWVRRLYLSATKFWCIMKNVCIALMSSAKVLLVSICSMVT